MPQMSLDNYDAEQLIRAHDGDVALLYIYCRHTGCYDLEEAARALCSTMQKLRDAEEKLQRMGLWRPKDAGSSPAVPPSAETPRDLPDPSDELPSMTALDIAGLSDGDPAFRGVVSEAVLVKGRALSSHELESLAGIYTYLGLPADVICLLLHHCLDQAESRQPGSRPGWAKIRTEAFRWARLELFTHELAEDHLRREAERGSAVSRIQTILNISGRPLTSAERKNILSWLDMGFDEGAVELAYERTVYNTGSLRWAYMNRIFQRWHASGWHDRATIEEKDGRRPATGGNPSGAGKVSIEDLNGILKQI